MKFTMINRGNGDAMEMNFDNEKQNNPKGQPSVCLYASTISSKEAFQGPPSVVREALFLWPMQTGPDF